MLGAAMLTELAPDDAALADLLGATHRRFQRLVEEAEVKARPYYRKVLGREASIAEVIAEIFAAVEREGDAAVARYGKIFDGAALPTDRLIVPPAEAEAAWRSVSPALRDAIATAIARRVRRM